MPYSSKTHTGYFASTLATMSFLRTMVDNFLIPFYPPMPMPHVDLYGKLAIVTGANSGVGFETARALAAMGAHVVLACRSEIKGEEARRKIVEITGNSQVELELLDCGKFASVHAFLERWERREVKTIDILINNAGGLTSTVAFTEDGLEQTYQSNHLAHLLLTHTLLNKGHISPSGRIVSISSVGYYESAPLDDQNTGGSDVLSKFQNQVGAQLTFDDMMELYRRSKACQAIWTMALQRKLAEREEWKGITAHSCHPGTVQSSIWAQPGGTGDMYDWSSRIFKRMASTFGISNEQGAVTPVWLAVSPQPEREELRGMYWDRMSWKWVRPWSLEDERQEKLWNKWVSDAGAPLR